MRILILSRDEPVIRGITHEFSETRNTIEILKRIVDVNTIGHTLIPPGSNIIILDNDLWTPRSPEIIRFIKKRYPDVPIIFLTSDSGIDLGRQISPLGVHLYFHKPVSSKEIVAAVLAIMRNQNQQSA
jgi:DNA-binding NarL/FixJ family response regulator